MYYTFSTQIPKAPGKIVIKPKGPSKFVLFETDRIYIKEKRYTKVNRVIIGKIADEAAGLMYPNDKFQTLFPDAVLPAERDEAYRSCCLNIGAYLVIQKVVQEYALDKMLYKILGESCGLFLDLVAYLIIEENNAGQYYPDFAFRHPLFSDRMRIYSDTSVSRLLNNVNKEQINNFLDAWNARRNKSQRIYISYDSTNKNCQAGDLDLVEFGKAKDDKGVPVFNLAIAFDKTNRVPLFYEEYPGSITDVSQFVYLVDKVIEYNYRKIGFVIDRGYFSKANIQYLDENSYTFIIMVKGCKALVSELVRTNRNTFEIDQKHSIRAFKLYGKTVTAKLWDGDVDRYFHIYFSNAKQLAERELIEQTVEKQQIFLDKHKGREIDFGKTYLEYFDLNYDKNGVFLYAVKKDAVIEQRLALCGYFCIVSSEKMTAAEAITHYKGRDPSVKLFRADKSFLGSKSMRVQSNEALSAKIFAEFIALIVRNRIYNLLRETLNKLDENPNYLTVPAAIRELEKIEMLRINSGMYRLDHAVSKRQKVILSAFGIDEEYVSDQANKIGNLLKNNQSLKEIDQPEPDDEEEL